MGRDAGYDVLTDPGQAYVGQPDHSQYPRNVAMFRSDDDVEPARSSNYSLDASSMAAAGQDIRSYGALAAPSETGQEWHAPAYSDVYPDATAYSQTAQQPYYGGYAQQSTDPSIYNSPWPPQAQSRTENFGSTSNDYSDSRPATMPYLGTSDTGVLDMNSSYDSTVATNLDGYGQDVEMSTDFVYEPEAGAQVGAPMDDTSHLVRNITATPGAPHPRKPCKAVTQGFQRFRMHFDKSAAMLTLAMAPVLQWASKVLRSSRLWHSGHNIS